MEEEGQNFYILLASNTANDTYENIPSNFRVPLPRELNLNKWEVGIAEVSYPCSIVNVEPEQNRMRFTIQPKDSSSHEYDFQIPADEYTSVEELLARINLKLHDARIVGSYDKTLGCVSFKITQNADAKFSLQLSYVLSTLLGLDSFPDGFNETNYMSKRADGRKLNYFYKADRHPKLTENKFAAFIYSDIVKPTIVSDTYAPLLGTFSYRGKYGDIVNERFRQIIYLPLAVSYFRSIEIAIRDSSGKLLDFQWGKVFILLHFRKSVLN